MDTPALHLAMASLLCEVASADHEQDQEKKNKTASINEITRSKMKQPHQLLTKAQQQSDAIVSYTISPINYVHLSNLSAINSLKLCGVPMPMLLLTH